MRKQTKIWKTQDGRKIRICDMDDSHLLNTIKMFSRVAEARRISCVQVYTSGCYPQGDMAQVAFESEFDQVLESTWEDYIPDIYQNFIDDYERRGLSLSDLDKYTQFIESNGLLTEVNILKKQLNRRSK